MLLFISSSLSENMYGASSVSVHLKIFSSFISVPLKNLCSCLNMTRKFSYGLADNRVVKFISAMLLHTFSACYSQGVSIALLPFPFMQSGREFLAQKMQVVQEAFPSSICQFWPDFVRQFITCLSFSHRGLRKITAAQKFIIETYYTI